MEFICECGRKFKSRKSLNSHARFCDKYVKKPKKHSIHKHDNIYKCECGREFDNHQALNGHFAHCDIHCKAYGKKKSDYHTGHKGCMVGWDKFTNDEKDKIHKKAGKTLSKNIKTGITKPAFLGRTHTEETKEKMRESTLNNIQMKCGGVRPNYSTKACEFINKLNEKYNWHLQHALNGGEFYVCGYFVDGYDKEKNIVFEYDEKKHYADVENNVLRECDLKRQENIIKELSCEFYRYNEILDLFYKV